MQCYTSSVNYSVSWVWSVNMFSSLKLPNLRSKRQGCGEAGPPHLDLTAPPSRKMDHVITTTRKPHKCKQKPFHLIIYRRLFFNIDDLKWLKIDDGAAMLTATSDNVFKIYLFHQKYVTLKLLNIWLLINNINFVLKFLIQ